MICTTYFLTFFSELIPPTGYVISATQATDPDSAAGTFMEDILFLFNQFENNFIFYTQDADNQHLSSIENYSIFQTDSNFVIKERCFYRERDKYTSIIVYNN